MFTDESQDVTPESVTEEAIEEMTDDVVEAPADTDWEAEAKRLQAELGKAKRLVTRAEKKVAAPSEKLGVEDFIDISTSLDGLDMREKAFLAEQHKLSGKPLKSIREGEDFQLWQSAYRQKQEAENALKPSTTQAVEDGPKTLTQRLREASLSEKEAILNEAGLYRSPRQKPDRVEIGSRRSF